MMASESYSAMNVATIPGAKPSGPSAFNNGRSFGSNKSSNMSSRLGQRQNPATSFSQQRPGMNRKNFPQGFQRRNNNSNRGNQNPGRRNNQSGNSK